MRPARPGSFLVHSSENHSKTSQVVDIRQPLTNSLSSQYYQFSVNPARTGNQSLSPSVLFSRGHMRKIFWFLSSGSSSILDWNSSTEQISYLALTCRKNYGRTTSCNNIHTPISGFSEYLYTFHLSICTVWIVFITHGSLPTEHGVSSSQTNLVNTVCWCHWPYSPEYASDNVSFKSFHSGRSHGGALRR